jgi:PIN domain nuclease of toxin-antitoxin system
MTRYLIDANILLFSLSDKEQLTKNVTDILDDYGNQVYISSESIKEIIHLLQSGRVSFKRWKSAEYVVDFINNETDVKIKYIREEHIKTLAKLPFLPDHKDPSDRMIIAQAITERIPLISSDRKFSCYEKYGLEFIYNKR